MNRGPSYDDLKSNWPICESYTSAMRAMGYHTLLDNSGEKSALAGASTDMGMHLPDSPPETQLNLV
jgi:hypothetical protein